jgi:hypothetical protein
VFFCRLLGRLAESGQLLEQSLDVLERSSLADRERQSASAFIFLQQGRLCYTQADFARGEAAYQQALLRYRALGDTWGEANVLLGLGSLAYRVGDYAQAAAAARARGRAGDLWATAAALLVELTSYTKSRSNIETSA